MPRVRGGNAGGRSVPRRARPGGQPTRHVGVPNSNVLDLDAAYPLAAALDHIFGAVGDLARMGGGGWGGGGVKGWSVNCPFAKDRGGEGQVGDLLICPGQAGRARKRTRRLPQPWLQQPRVAFMLCSLPRGARFARSAAQRSVGTLACMCPAGSIVATSPVLNQPAASAPAASLL